MKFLLILSHSFRFYKEKIKEIALIAFIFLLNFLWIRLLILPTSSLNMRAGIFFGYCLLTLLWIFLSNSLFELLILHLVKLPNSSLKEIFTESFLRVFPYLWLKIFLGVIIFLGLLLFFIPGIILAIYLSFSLYAFIDQDLSIFQSLKESWRLVKGNWWLIFKMVILFSLLVISFSFILWTILFFGFKVSNFNLIGSTLGVFGVVIGLFNFLFLAPLNLIFFYYLYFFVKKQKDQLEEVELELTQ